MFQLPDLFDVCLPRPHLGEEGAGQGGEDGGVPAGGFSLPPTSTNRSGVILLLLQEQTVKVTAVHVNENLALFGPERR